MSSSNDSLAMQRITKLVDENSFMEIGSLVTARNTDFNLADTDTPSDGVMLLTNRKERRQAQYMHIFHLHAAI